MSLLLETIRILNGQPQNLSRHEARVTLSQETLNGQRRLPKIRDIILKTQIPESGLYKARLVYEEDSYSIEYHKYKKQEITDLVLVKIDSLAYNHKYADRTVLNELKTGLKEKSEALIVIDNQIIETTYTNIAFKKNNRWFTPKKPILRGTMRAKLIEDKIIIPLDIRIEDLKYYTVAKLFNAMMPWNEAIEIPVENIKNEKN